MRVVTQTAWTVMFGDWAGAATPFQPWVEFNGFVAGIQCGATDGYAHPDYPSGPQPTVSPSGTAVDPYAMATAEPANCQRTTGT